MFKNCKFEKFELSLFLMILWCQNITLFLPFYSSLETHVFTIPDTQITKVKKLQICEIWTELLFDDIMMRKQQSMNRIKLFLPLYSSLETHVFTVPDTQINKVKKIANLYNLNLASFWIYNDAKISKRESFQTVLTVVLIAWNTCFHRSRYANKQSSKIANL